MVWGVTGVPAFPEQGPPCWSLGAKLASLRDGG